MRDYIILNGVNSNTITGLLISTLPPITKPKIRTQTEEIDGRDGDIVTKLGYSAYDKEIEIGLYGDFDIDDVIAYFNSEGTVTFSNEPDKFYNYQILDQIDYEKLIRFKKAKVKMHVQPFKYPLEETPVEITNQYVNNEAEEMDLDNTKEAPMTIALKGNTYQDSTTGKNLYNKYGDFNYPTTAWGDATILLSNGTIKTVANFSASASRGIRLSLEQNTNYTVSGKLISSTGNVANDIAVVRAMGYSSSWSAITNYHIASVGDFNFTFNSGNNNDWFISLNSNGTTGAGISYEAIYDNIQVEKGTTKTTYEPYTNGASPNPDYPQDISVVSGDNEIKVEGKNLWSLGNMSFTGWAIGSNDIKNLLNSLEIGTYTITLKAKVKTITNPQTTYRWGIYSSGTGFALDVRNNLTQTLQVGDIITNQVTFPINNNNKGKFVNAYTYTISSTSGVVAGTVELFETQLEKNNQATEYQEYKEATYQITLPEGTELCKIGDYQDRIYKDSDKWYIEKQIGKVVLNGSETWVLNESGTGYVRFTTTESDLISTSVSDVAKYFVISDRFVSSTSNQTVNANADKNRVCAVTNKRLLFKTLDTALSTTQLWKTWLSSNNVEVRYVLNTPTATEITDETLKAQLEALANATSYDTKTHITQNANDKPFILNATALQQGSGEATVNNEGNIYSKPTLDIEGSGTVGIYLDGNQMFSVDLSNATECIIDTAQLEAYNPSTDALMNRQVTGDYSNFKLNAGENQVSTTGEITKVTISNYTRWL